MRLKRFTAVAALVLLLVCGCGGNSQDASQGAQAQLLRRGLGGQPGSLDPHRAEDAFAYDVLRDLYEGLTVSGPTGEVLPAAAESWRVDDDGKRYTFRLRQDAFWSNGDLVSAGDLLRHSGA